MSLIFDTSVLIEIDSINEKLLLNLIELKEKYPANPAIAFPTFSEYYYGFLGKSKDRAAEALKRLGEFELLNTTENSARLFAEIAHGLSRKGETIPVMDVLIASIAMDYGMTLLTFDAHFRRIEGLKAIVLEG